MLLSYIQILLCSIRSILSRKDNLTKVSHNIQRTDNKFSISLRSHTHCYNQKHLYIYLCYTTRSRHINLLIFCSKTRITCSRLQYLHVNNNKHVYHYEYISVALQRVSVVRKLSFLIDIYVFKTHYLRTSRGSSFSFSNFITSWCIYWFYFHTMSVCGEKILILRIQISFGGDEG